MCVSPGQAAPAFAVNIPCDNSCDVDGTRSARRTTAVLATAAMPAAADAAACDPMDCSNAFTMRNVKNEAPKVSNVVRIHA